MTESIEEDKIPSSTSSVKTPNPSIKYEENTENLNAEEGEQ
jgi:hypothetical protein